LRDDPVLIWLGYVGDAAEQALTYIEGLDRESFLSDPRTCDAVVMKLIVIGEYAGRIRNARPDIATNSPHLDWANMRSVRNRIAHDYFSIDFDIVWEIARDDLPLLTAALPALVELARCRPG
jgi:uncharacterized protein with HEPN domain